MMKSNNDRTLLLFSLLFSFVVLQWGALSDSFSDTKVYPDAFNLAQISKQVTPQPKPAPVHKTSPIPSKVPVEKPLPAPIQKPAQIPMTIRPLDDLVVERIWLDNNCQINVSLMNRNAQKSNANFSNLFVRVNYGKTKDLQISRLSPRGSLAGPGGRATINTHITLKIPTNVTVIADSRNAIREDDENNNQLSTLLRPQCVSTALTPKAAQIQTPKTDAIKAPTALPPMKPMQAPTMAPRNLSTAPEPVQLPQQAMKPQAESAHTMKSQTFGAKAPVQPTLQQPGQTAISKQKMIAATPMTQMSQPVQPGEDIKLTPTAVVLPKITLETKSHSGEMSSWGKSGAAETSYQNVDFRWKVSDENITHVNWEVAMNPGFSYVIDSGIAGSMPKPDQYYNFSVDLNRFSSTYTKPVTFYFHVKPVKVNIKPGMASKEGTSSMTSNTVTVYQPSSPVKITLTEAGSSATTDFSNLPVVHLRVVFEKVLIIDDADDLSGGDFKFWFRVDRSYRTIRFDDGQYSSGDTITLNNMIIDIPNPPKSFVIRVQGIDFDVNAFEVLSPGTDFYQFGKLVDSDTAEVSGSYFSYATSGRWKSDPKQFTLNANGERLKFEVQGHYALFCDPCP